MPAKVDSATRAAPSITYTPSESSQVAEYGYDAATKTLGVKFRRGGEYFYYDVPQATADAMTAAPSHGKFVDSDLRDKFDYARAPAAPVAA